MKINTVQDAIDYLKNLSKELDEVCSNFHCGNDCPFMVDDECTLSDRGYIDVDGAIEAVKRNLKNISFTAKKDFSKEIYITVKNDFKDYCNRCPMAKYEIFCKPCKENKR